jgi:hypothetical protein
MPFLNTEEILRTKRTNRLTFAYQKVAYLPENRKNYKLRIIMQLIDKTLCIVSAMGVSSYASKSEQACAGSSPNPV